MDNKHTPGPWEADVKKYPIIIRSKNALQKCVADGGFEFTDGTGAFIADAMDSEANARLIAAAPELLAALQMVVEDNCLYVARPETFEAALAAVAKARGNNDD